MQKNKEKIDQVIQYYAKQIALNQPESIVEHHN